MHFIAVPFLSLLIAFALSAAPASAATAGSACPAGDADCREFERLAETDQFDRLVETVRPGKKYSEAARSLVGRAYLMLAGRETNTSEQEEQFCLKALEYGATSAYMGLYFIHAGTDEEKALSYLRQYVATQPKDSVPYVILGEEELRKNNAAMAVAYLREARKTARGRSVNLEWLLFQASYLSGDFPGAADSLASSLAQGKTRDDVDRLIAADRRFAGMDRRPELGKVLSPAETKTVPSR